MSIQLLAYLVTVFVVVFGIAIVAMRFIVPNIVQVRLRQLSVDKIDVKNSRHFWVERIAKLTTPLAGLTAPKEGWAKSSLRTQFMHAGIRGDAAPAIFLGGQTLLLIALPALLWLNLALWSFELPFIAQIFCLMFVAVLGFFAPKIILRRMIKSRQRDIYENLPNALDLLTICMEAGLVIDAGIARVSHEMSLTSPALSEELHIVTLELRAGSNKEKALRNLTTRTGVEEINVLVSMLIQTERFGTSIADALRVHSEHLRLKRRQKAEEAAAKIAVKLLLPMIFCIFPAIFIVILGPAGIQAFGSMAQAGSIGSE